MKRIILLLPIAIIMIGCKSKEEKATELIKAHLFKTLFDYQSLEIVEIKVDSSFASPMKNDTALLYAKNAIKWDKEINKYSEKSEIERIKQNYKAALIYIDAAKDCLENFEKYLNASDSIKAEIKPEFDGWEAKLRFRAKNRGGNYGLSDYIFYFDKDMKEITNYFDVEDDEYKELYNFLVNEKISL